MIKLVFSQIDAKEFDVIATNMDDGRPQNANNYNVLEDAMEEYLLAIQELQKTIREKYESRLNSTQEPNFDVDVLDEKRYGKNESIKPYLWRTLGHLYYT